MNILTACKEMRLRWQSRRNYRYYINTYWCVLREIYICGGIETEKIESCFIVVMIDGPEFELERVRSTTYRYLSRLILRSIFPTNFIRHCTRFPGRGATSAEENLSTPMFSRSYVFTICISSIHCVHAWMDLWRRTFIPTYHLLWYLK